jgi:hypothetical protein
LNLNEPQVGLGVPDNYHVEYDGFYYPVPHNQFKQEVSMQVTAATVEIIIDNRE